MTIKSILKTMDRLDANLEKLIEKRSSTYGKRSDRWRESSKGDEYDELTCKLQELKEGIEDHITELST